MKIAISGAGVAGPSLAHWLHRTGHQPTLIERAPQFRTGGYVIDFWGVGYRVAQLMGIEAAVRESGYQVQSIRSLGRDGQVRASLGVDAVRRGAGAGFTSLPRGDLAATIYATIENDVETIFDDSITAINEHLEGVSVSFAQAKTRDFDLVIGADGLHSNVRRLTFGPESDVEHYLGYRVAACVVEGYRPRDDLVYVTYSLPGQSVARFSLRGDRSLFCSSSAQSTPAILVSWPRGRPCCAASSVTQAGNARTSLPRSTVSMICTSMSSARSAWIAGRGAERRSSATRPPVFPCWRERARVWR
jgi:2-polyprenyl-6-methoxyphenol hydroxylase-like FAD-dependent oxidoreductase